MLQRENRFDLIRFILIGLAVFGHFMEAFGLERGPLSMIIYSFHMPLFLFVSGYFSRFNRRKWLLEVVYPYVLFQVAYLLLRRLLDPQSVYYISLLQPVLLMWFLLCLALCQLLIPLFESNRRGMRIFVLSLSVLLALLAGYDPRIGRFITLSRLIVFLPFFIGGYYARRSSLFQKFLNTPLRKKLSLLLLSLVAVGTSVVYYGTAKGSVMLSLYGATPYILPEGPGLTDRILFLCTACAWGCLLFCLVPNRRIPLASTIGSNTLPVYLLHGFLFLYLQSLGIRFPNMKLACLVSAGITIVLLLLFGNRYFGRVFRLLFTGRWIGCLIDRYRAKKAASKLPALK